MKLRNLLNVGLVAVSIVFCLILLGLAEELTRDNLTEKLTRDNAGKPIVFLQCVVPKKMEYQGKEYEIWLRDPNTNKRILLEERMSGTGVIVGYQNETYLVTAKHVAQKTSIAWSAIISGPNDLAVTFPFTEFTGYTKDMPWITHPVADVAVLRLKGDSKYCKSGMIHRFDISVFVRTEEAPGREKVLTILGFPLALGIGQKISPLEKETKAASGLYDIPDGPNMITVFFLSDPSIDGYSGAPVFSFPIVIGGGSTTIRVDSGRTICYGLVSATLSDRTGGKLARVVPSSQICETIIRAHEREKKKKDGS
jgi:hypothetical protein